MAIQLPLVLAGPILRRATPDEILVWIATSEPISFGVEVYRESMAGGFISIPIGEGLPLRIVKLGAKLFVQLISVKPVQSFGPFPVREVLAYDLFELIPQVTPQPLMKLPNLSPKVVRRQTKAQRRLVKRQAMATPMTVQTRSTGKRLHNFVDPFAYTYGAYKFPTFVLQDPARNELVALYGSCRKLHGDGPDASPAANELIGTRASNVETRPTALFLTGDQIYADDVSRLLFRPIRDLAKELTGTDEFPPGLPHSGFSEFDKGPRHRILENYAKFSSGAKEHHVITFGEYAALYLLAWNQNLWPALAPVSSSGYEDWLPLVTPVSLGVHPNPLKVPSVAARNERDALDNSKSASIALRRVMANTPTYMIFDDHEVTDDWNLNKAWESDVNNSGFGKRILANGLAAYWAFQGWGNNPEDYPAGLINTIESHMADPQPKSPGSGFEKTMLDFHGWSFVAPTRPRAAFLDSRTKRGAPPSTDRDFLHFENPLSTMDGNPISRPNRAPRLLGRVARERASQLLKAVGQREPLIFIAAAPVFSVDQHEQLQMFIGATRLANMIDPESWRVNKESLLDFMDLVFARMPDPCIILSGDVHFGFAAHAVVENGKGERVRVAQYCSSPMKNVGLAKFLSQPVDIRREVYWRTAGGTINQLHVTGNVSRDYEAGLRSRLGPFHTAESVHYDEVLTGVKILTTNNIGELRFGNLVTNQFFGVSETGGGGGTGQLTATEKLTLPPLPVPTTE